MSNDTIYALATPPGTGALAIIRICGNSTLKVVQNLTKKNLANLKPNTAVFCKIYSENKVLDEVILSYFKTPHSFTGEDIIEITCHGSPFIIHETLKLLSTNGARIAAPGEFSMRAYLNGKMDLVQAEAIADIIAAETANAHNVAMNQMKGHFSNDINNLKNQLINFASLMELELDFSEEDVEFANRTEFKNLLDELFTTINPLIDSFKIGDAIKNGIPVVIAGKPNAGKSSLLNSLLKEERAIVSEIAGTTRDTIEEDCIINGIKFKFIDTAGLRHAGDQIEALGIKRALEKVNTAALVLYVFDLTENTVDTIINDTKLLSKSSEQIILVGNKRDKCKDLEKNINEFQKSFSNSFIALSALKNEGIHELKQLLFEKSVANNINTNASMVTNLRHLEALRETKNALTRVEEGLKNNLSGDLIAMDIRQALYFLGSITGTIVVDDILGTIFSRFCIGK